MRLPSESAGYVQYVRYGRYVFTRLRHSKLEEMAMSVNKVTGAIKEAGRMVEDAAEPVQEAMAERDSCDSDLDENAQEFRLKLSSRSLDAARKAPYTQIFPNGLDYYIASTLGDVVNRYKELATRIEANLPEGDELRSPTVAALNEGIHGFAQSVTKLEEARTNLSMARTKREAAEDEWESVMEKTFGLLVVEFGRKKANRFFPRARRVRSAEGKDE